MALHNHNAVTLSSAVHVRYALGSELKTDMVGRPRPVSTKGSLEGYRIGTKLHDVGVTAARFFSLASTEASSS